MLVGPVQRADGGRAEGGASPPTLPVLAMASAPQDGEWANTERTIPRQSWSLVGSAARSLRRSPSQVPRPWCLLKERAPLDHPLEGGYHKALEEETAIVQEAHASVHRLTALCDDEEAVALARFCRAETAELQAAAGHFGPRGKPTGTLPARPAALTVLVEAAHNSDDKKHAALVLDAAAFLARVGSDTERLVGRVRVAVLFRAHARKYGHERLGSARPPRGKASVCLTWVEEGSLSEEGALRSRHAELGLCDSAQAYVERIRDAAASLVPECTPSTALACRALSALSRSLDLGRSPIAGAHDASVVECDREFWALLRRAMPALASTAVVRTNEGEHSLDWFQGGGLPCCERVFLKLVPRSPHGAPPLASEHVYHGLLLHKHGEHDEAMHFCKKQTARERQNTDPNTPWGLPIPSTPPDAWLGLHVLCVRSEWACLAAQLGAYGVGMGVPGTCPTKNSDGHLLRLVFNLVPFDARFVEGTFALPCKMDLAAPLQDGSFLMEATDAAFVSYRSIFNGGVEDESEAEGVPVPSRFGLAKHANQALPEDLALANAFGVPFGSGAFRIGDVHERLTLSDFPAPHLDGFLRTAIEQLGRDQSLSSAFALLAQKCKLNETLLGEKRALESRVSELEGQLLAAEAPASPKRAKGEPTNEQPETCIPHDRLWTLLAQLGCIEKSSVTLEAPIERGKVLGLLLAIQRARGLDQECKDTSKAKSKEIRKSGLLDAEGDCDKRIKLVMGTEARFPDTCPLVFVWTDGGRPVQFEWPTHVADEEGVRWGTVPVDSIGEIFGPGKSVGVLVFDQQTRDLTPYFRPAAGAARRARKDASKLAVAFPEH